jgi:hypothetical protein
MDLRRLLFDCPPALEDPLVEALLESEPPLPGFLTLHAEGHGADQRFASVREQVRGRAARRVIVLVLPAERVPTLLAELRRHFAGSDVHWIEQSVVDEGSLG